MQKSKAHNFETLKELIEEYVAFQRSRPDLPQGNILGLSEDELEELVAAFLVFKSGQPALRPTRLH